PPPSAGSLAGSETPFLLFLGKGVDEKRAGTALAGLEAPLAKALSSGSQAPTFRKHRVGGVTAHSLPLSNTVDLTYAIVESALVIATDPAGVQQVASGGERRGRPAAGRRPHGVAMATAWRSFATVAASAELKKGGRLRARREATFYL